MRERNTRVIVVAGVIATAVLATFLLMPAIRQLGWPDAIWVGAAIMILPTAALLTATGYPHYGLPRSLAIGLVVMVLTGIITWVVAVFTFAAALAGSGAATVMGIVMYATPAACVLVFGLLALRLVPARAETADDERERAGTT